VCGDYHHVAHGYWGDARDRCAVLTLVGWLHHKWIGGPLLAPTVPITPWEGWFLLEF